MKYYAIIVAGGRGKRMGADIPKQFLLLNGLPLLFYSINAFYTSRFKPTIIIVMDEAYHETWNALCDRYTLNVPHLYCHAGTERFHSVKNGLQLVVEDGFVAVHDAARPLIDTAFVDALYTSATVNGSAVPCIKPVESVRFEGKSINRDEVCMIQTPQIFDTTVLKKAYLQDFSPHFTDDAGVVENTGVAINLVEGRRTNLKVTWPEDFSLATFYLNK